MRIRKATVKDFKKVKDIKTEFMFWEAKRDKGIDPEKIKKVPFVLRGKLKNKDMAFFLAEEKGEVIGFAWAEKQKNKFFWTKYPFKGYLHDLYVKKEYRKKGIGKKLINECFKWFKKKKFKYWEVGVHAWNIGAKKLYQKKGFEEHIVWMRQIKK
ncbi:MAG: GNAT family N-acetyltransferase [Nanoarchaeota archaeon]|nr:GNAT family N-acetyltransferase [Nanoarchaeota archaeon]